MNLELLEKAKARIPSVPVLVNLVSLRVKQLNEGMRPYVKPASQDEDKLDIALREIAEGKIIAQVDFDALARRQELQEQYAQQS
ncbi:MAG: DNA-directed RNA polymerase subunit omega [Lentisphaerae bacterium]|nr:DNA-directed RNA polymerase subunit omega [Lentisphaerota bacterium]